MPPPRGPAAALQFAVADADHAATHADAGRSMTTNRILGATLVAAAAIAAGSALAQGTGGSGGSGGGPAFDGVWAKPGAVTLIKQFPKHLMLQGKDEASAWSAQCMLSEGRGTCRGSGYTITGQHFAFESQIALEGNGLRDRWRAVFADAKELTGDDLLQPVSVPPMARRR
jgi:hypothetical protein